MNEELFALHKIDTWDLVVQLSDTKLNWLLRDFLNGMVHCDNKSPIQITQNSVFHKMTKHIEIDCHITHHHLQHKTLTLPFVHSFK